MPITEVRPDPSLDESTRRPMRIGRHHIASALFGCAALAFLAVWYIFLFVGTPARIPLGEHLTSLLAYSFSEPMLRWRFAVLAAMPVVFCLLAVAAWRAPSATWRFPSPAAGFALVSTVFVAVVVSWEIAIFSGAATYLAVFNRGDR